MADDLEILAAEIVENESNHRRGSIEHALAQGKLLSEAFKLCGGNKRKYGEFMRSANLAEHLSQRTALRYRKLYEEHGEDAEAARRAGLSNGAPHTTKKRGFLSIEQFERLLALIEADQELRGIFEKRRNSFIERV